MQCTVRLHVTQVLICQLAIETVLLTYSEGSKNTRRVFEAYINVSNVNRNDLVVKSLVYYTYISIAFIYF
jgi:hypothetical protein